MDPVMTEPLDDAMAACAMLNLVTAEGVRQVLEDESDPETGVLISQGGLTGRWYAITSWHHEPSTFGGTHVVSDEKHDITDQISDIEARAGIKVLRKIAERFERRDGYFKSTDVARVLRDLADKAESGTTNDQESR
jgi:hypothetical protein